MKTGLLATSAMLLGMGNMLIHASDVLTKDDISVYNLPTVFVGVSSSLLWALYQVNNNSPWWFIYTFGFFIQLYILTKLLTQIHHRRKTI